MVTVVLMLVMLVLVSLYTAKIQSFEHRILLNSQNQLLAKAAAEAAIQRGFAELQQNRLWQGNRLEEDVAGQFRFEVSASQQTLRRGTSALVLFELQAKGQSADGLASAQIHVQALRYPLLATLPAAPLMLEGSLHYQTRVELVANPNGAGDGVPLSLWSNRPVDFSVINAVTCGLHEFQQGQCSSQAYSNSSQRGADVLDNDSQFPDDIFAHLFNLPREHYAVLRNEAQLIVADCQGLDNQFSGVVWVQGDCQLNADIHYGSQSAPLLLLVNQGDVSLADNTHLYGLLVLLKPQNDVSDYGINMGANSAVYGALAANQTVGRQASMLRVVYVAEVLRAIQQLPQFSRILKVPGSWRDY